MKKLCWIGQIVPDDKVGMHPAHSAASNVWQLNFLNALLSQDSEITVIAYIPERTWPMGELWVKSGSDYSAEFDKFEVIYFSYLNIKILRDLWLFINMSFYSIFKLYNNKFDICFTYNPLLQHRYLAKFFTLFNFSRFWISIVADGYTKMRPSATIFLSKYYFESSLIKKKMLFEGAIETSIANGSEKLAVPPYILYAGSKSEITGIRKFVIDFDRISNPKFLLKIYGPGLDKVINDISAINNNIIIYPFASKDELEIACLGAHGFVNPRGLSRESLTTFPSKLLFYMRFCKPILSANNPVIDPKYDSFLIKYDINYIDELYKALNSLEDINYEDFEQKALIFNMKNTWQQRVKSLMSDLESVLY